MNDAAPPATRWTDSIFVRAGALLAAIAALAVASIAIAAVYADYSSGRGTAINLAGSLRMQAWRMAALLEHPEVPAEEVSAAIEQFERVLMSDRLNSAVPGDATHPAAAAFARVRDHWTTMLRPALAAAAARGGERRVAPDRVSAFVEQVEVLVEELERMLERSITELRLIQGIALFVMLVLIVAAMYFIQSRVMDPLARLVDAARRVQALDFSARVAHVDEDELGELGAVFNRMVQEVSALTRDLEDRVARKTAELERSNHTLETLYGVTRVLGEQPPDEVALQRILEIVRAALGAEATLVCRRPGDGAGVVVAGSGAHRRAADLICGARNCEACASSVPMPAGAGRQVVSVTLRDAGRTLGVLPIAIRRDRQLEHWELRLLDSLGQHIAAAMHNAERIDADRSFALYEERAAIARELHDSLAQSLSYLKIQVSRLEKSLAESSADDARRAARLAIIEELRTGLSSAYRELRELLTTFRLRIDESGFAASLAHAVAEFGRRSGVDAVLANRLGNLHLSAHEQVHVLQIVREALANTEHHARARHARVELDADALRGVTVSIADDGVGIADPAPQRTHHYGTSIMRDRAATLGGTLDIAPGADGGTCVTLRFTSKTAYASRGEEAVRAVELRRVPADRRAATEELPR